MSWRLLIQSKQLCAMEEIVASHLWQIFTVGIYFYLQVVHIAKIAIIFVNVSSFLFFFCYLAHLH